MGLVNSGNEVFKSRPCQDVREEVSLQMLRAVPSSRTQMGCSSRRHLQPPQHESKTTLLPLLPTATARG